MPLQQPGPGRQRAGHYVENRLGCDRPPIPSLTGLRFVAALLVLVSHSVTFMIPLGSPVPLWQRASLALAYVGMSLFFVLSGFVIHYNYSLAISESKVRGTYNFFISRLARLVPLYAACVLFDVFWRYLYGQLPDASARSLMYYATMTQSWFYNISGEHSLIFQFGIMPQVSWSISTELFFYIVYPFICFGLTRFRRPEGVLIVGWSVVTATFVFLAVLSCYLSDINDMAISHFGDPADVINHPFDSFLFWLLYFSPYLRLPEFLLGIVTAAIFLNVKDRAVSQREHAFGIAAAWIAIAALGAIFWSLYPHDSLIVEGEPSFLSVLKMNFGFAPAIALLIFCIARYRSPLVSFLSLPKIIVCGEASYSLYMLHLEVVYAFRWTVSPVISINVGIANGMRWGLLLVTAVGSSIVIWQTVELPARRWLRQRLLVRDVSERTISGGVGHAPQA